MTDRAQAVDEAVARLHYRAFNFEGSNRAHDRDHAADLRLVLAAFDAVRAEGPQTPTAGEGREKVARVVLRFQYGDSMAEKMERDAARGWLRALYAADEIAALPSPTAGPSRGELESRAVPCQGRPPEQGLAARLKGALEAVDQLATQFNTHDPDATMADVDELLGSICESARTALYVLSDVLSTEAGGSTGGRLGNQNPNSLPVEEG